MQGIIMQGPSVLSTLAGNKTQMRRVIKEVKPDIISICKFAVPAKPPDRPRSVELAFKSNFNIPFAKIKLFSSDRYIDSEATFDGACQLGDEIARRWNIGRDDSKQGREKC